jgi:hypothetical protein
MEKYKGREAEIFFVNPETGNYRLNVDERRWWWTKDWLEPLEMQAVSGIQPESADIETGGNNFGNGKGSRVNPHLLCDQQELLLVFRVLLADLKKKLETGTAAVYPPFKFVLPEKRIEYKEIKKYLVLKTGETKINFSYEAEETGFNQVEAIRRLAVTLYHLVKGQSEFSHECYSLDGYLEPLDSELWPTIKAMLNKELFSLTDLEKRIEDAEKEIKKITL